MATVTCKTADGVERTVTVESENTCPLYSYGEEHKEYIGTFEKPSAPENPSSVSYTHLTLPTSG